MCLFLCLFQCERVSASASASASASFSVSHHTRSQCRRDGRGGWRGETMQVAHDRHTTMWTGPLARGMGEYDACSYECPLCLKSHHQRVNRRSVLRHSPQKNRQKNHVCHRVFSNMPEYIPGTNREEPKRGKPTVVCVISTAHSPYGECEACACGRRPGPPVMK
jgi:hypothetical protein